MVEWATESPKGLSYIYTDNGAFMKWIFTLQLEGRRAITASATLMLKCPEVGDKKGLKVEQIDKDREWCR